MTSTSRTLLERVRDRRDGEAWERFFELYAPLLEGYARSLGLVQSDAAEVRDQCLAVVARKMPQFTYDEVRGGFQGWLYRIVRGKVVDLRRRRSFVRGSEPPGEDLTDPGPTPDEVWERHWRAEHLRFALERVRTRVSEGTWTLFREVALEEQPVAEVCARYEVSANQVYKAKGRVLAGVRDALAMLGVEELDLG